MNKLYFISLLATAVATNVLADDFGTGANEFEIEFALMGNAGNAADIGGYGDVAYNYKIGIFEVTVDQFSKAWNLDNRISDGDEAYWDEPGRDLGEWAPVVNVSWQEAAKLCNWLTSGDAHAGAYTVSGGIVTGVDRATAISTYGLVYIIPTEDEWYKAAYYTGTGYSDYANGTDTIPVKGPEGANYDYYYPDPGKPWAVWNNVGEHNGTFNMNGNVWEICEDGVDLLIRGGAFDEPPTGRKDGADQFFEAIEVGLRVAAITSTVVGEDDFNDGSTDTLKWAANWSSPYADFIESGGRLSHTNNPANGGTYEDLFWVENTLSYIQSWDVTMDVSSAISPSSLSEDQGVDFGLGVAIGDYVFVVEHRTLPSGYEFYTKAGDIPSDQVFFGNGEPTVASQARLVLSFDADQQIISSSYVINGETFELESISTETWGMNAASAFTPLIQVDNSSVPISLGQLSIDNFRLYIGKALKIERSVENLGITKTALYTQTDASTTTPAGASFYTSISGDNLTAYYPSGPVTIIGLGGTIPVPFNGNKRWYEDEYASISAMNSAMPNGIYTMNLAGTNVMLNFSPETYPIVPVCSSSAGSWVGGRLRVSSAEAAAGFSLSSISSTENGFLSIELHDADYEMELREFETHSSATNVMLDVPVGELEVGVIYTVEVEFDHVVNNTDASHIDAGVWAYALYSSRTTFEIEVVDTFSTLPTSFGESFSSNQLSSLRWKPLESEVSGSLTVSNQRLEYSAPSGTSTDEPTEVFWDGPLPIDKNWVAEVTIHNGLEYNSGIGLVLYQPGGDETIFNELDVGVDENIERGILTSLESGEEFYGEVGHSLPGVLEVRIRLSYTASNQVVEASVDPDSSGPLSFQSLATFGLTGSGGATGNRDWNLSSTNRFSLSLAGSAGSGGIVASGLLWADDFSLTISDYERPSLAVAPMAGNLQLTWPIEAGVFRIECSESLTNTTWCTVTNQPSSNGSNLTIELPTEQNQQYFRLSY